MTEENNGDYVLYFEAPKIIAPEFRLYYNEEDGSVLFYTCEKPEGKYIVIDSVTFACARYDLIVQDGRIVTDNITGTLVSKLVVAQEGLTVMCDDISIIANEETTLNTQKVKLKNYEL